MTPEQLDAVEEEVHKGATEVRERLIREALRDRLGIDAPSAAIPDPLPELQRRRQQLAPEAVAGDETAIAQLEEVDAEIAAETRRRDLVGLAATEQADRDRTADEEEAERQRADWLLEAEWKDAVSAAELANFERALTETLTAGRAALENAQQAATLRKQAGEGYGTARPLVIRVENRLVWRISTELGFGIQPGRPRALLGRPSLVAPLVDELADLGGPVGPTVTIAAKKAARPASPGGPRLKNVEVEAANPGALGGVCTVCASADVAAINSALDEPVEARESLRSLAARFGVSRSALSRHSKHRPT